VTPQVREALASTLRAVLIPAPGKVFADLDYSKIEPITLAWLVGAVRRLVWIRSGGPLYEAAVAKFFQMPPEQIKGERRQVGKILELLAAYAGEGRRLHAELIKAGIQASERDAHQLIAGWRRDNPEFVRFWHESVTAFAATTTTGMPSTFAGGKVRFERDGDRLCCVLPSGGVVSYWHPSAERGFDGAWRIAHKVFKGGQWWPSRLHAGTLAENITSSLSRDALATAMVQAERAGVQIVLHAHDQIVAEGTPEDLERLRAAMENLPPWAAELELKTSGGLADCFTK
jgi:DNA polymerase